MKWNIAGYLIVSINLLSIPMLFSWVCEVFSESLHFEWLFFFVVVHKCLKQESNICYILLLVPSSFSSHSNLYMHILAIRKYVQWESLRVMFCVFSKYVSHSVTFTSVCLMVTTLINALVTFMTDVMSLTSHTSEFVLYL